MRKKLTVNTLAFGNLKNHKKQYAVMIIGIILAMVFSSSVIISIFSLNASTLEMGRNAVGIQDVIMLNVTEQGMQEAEKKGYLDEYGFAHMIGFASTDVENEKNGFYIAWLDDTAKKLSYQSFIEGAYPTNENEIAIEESVLTRLGIEANIGDEISLSVFSQNGISHIENATQKTYKLVGVVKDKATGIEMASYGSFLRNVPSAFVCEGTETSVGGKESLVSYLTFADFDYPAQIQEGDYWFGNTRFSEFNKYITEKYGIEDLIDESVNQEFMTIETNYRHSYYGSYSMESLIMYAGVIGVVLALASCIAIVNSFNSNIKERKQQIGMLRAVGTTRKQITRILSREALIISVVSIPISLVISYLFVLALSNVFGEDFVLTIDILSIVCCGAVGLITVMLAALIPIIHATKITPMQAIRNIDVTRKMKTKKIKTQKEFSVPKLLAKRSMAFHKGNQIAVSVILVSTILFSCVGFSFVSYENKQSRYPGYDYVVSNDYTGGGNQAFVNSFDNSGGISDSDKQNITSAPYISKAFGVKSCRINLLIDEYTDYFKILSGYDVYANYGLDDAFDGSNYKELIYGSLSEYYTNVKSQAGVTKDFLPTTLYAMDDWKLEELEKNLVSGSIHLDKLASGEEVILVAPQKAAICAIRNGKSFFDITLLDNEIDYKFDYNIYGEYEFKAGDTIDLNMIMGDPDDAIYTETENIYNLKKIDKKVKVGAVISPEYFNSGANQWILRDDNFGVLTSIAGMNKFLKVQYECIYMFADGEITDEINEAVTSYVKPLLYKYDGNINSSYESDKNLEEENNSMLVAMLSVIIIGFAICASLTNNAFTASIRERKRELGTLRAVGISRKEFVESYVRQLLKTFAVGYGIGFGLFALGYLACTIIVYFKNQSAMHYFHESEVAIDFNPWITIAFCIVLFAICGIHLWLKIKKEMKNSIIENIREL